MNIFALNLVLAFAWQALSGSFTLFSLVSGFALGYVALWFVQPLFGERSSYYGHVWAAIRLAVYFLWELIISSFRVAWEVITPGDTSRAQIVEMPLDVKSDIEILLVTNLISLTPGTLSLDVTEDRETLFIHAMFVDDPDELVRSLKNGMERMVKEVFEP
jgi:multicomponent Na+:H+ antiporter subunit E